MDKIPKGDFAAGLNLYLKRSRFRYGKHLATALEASPATISNYLTGKAHPTLTMLLRICRELHTHPSAILGFETLPPAIESLNNLLDNQRYQIQYLEGSVKKLHRELSELRGGPPDSGTERLDLAP